MSLFCLRGVLRATWTLISCQVEPQIGVSSLLSTNFPLTGYIHSNYHCLYLSISKVWYSVLSPVFETNLWVCHHQKDALLFLILFESEACLFGLQKEIYYICRNQNCEALMVTFLGLHMTYCLYYIGFDISRLSNRVENYFPSHSIFYPTIY